MAEFTFPCPSCHQGIQCDEAWIGHQIECPICKAQLRVPQKTEENPLVPKPGSGGSKLKAGPTQVARSSSGVGAPHVAFKKPVKKGNPALAKFGGIAAAIVIIGAGAYFGYPYFQKWQESRKAAEEEALAAAQPAPEPEVVDPVTEAANAMTNQPAGSPTWAMDLSKVEIPNGRVNGSIAGTNFLADTVRFDRVALTWVLNIRQGTGQTPDRGVLVYLKVPPGESPANRTITVNPEDKPEAVAYVTKLWKPNPRYAAQQRNFMAGYALKLELGAANETEMIPGKIYLALPDAEKSVLAGIFAVSTAAPVPGMGAVPVQVPVTPEDPAARQRFESRYGISGR